MTKLKKNPTLRDLQKYMKQLCAERGWERDSALEKFLLFVEEVGELAKEIRKANNLYVEKGKDAPPDLRGEMADILNYLLDIANHFDIDLEDAFREKDEINSKRKWAKNTK